jgi:hypothetical protein
MHDRCLRLAIEKKTSLTEADMRTLNLVASGWAADLEVTALEYDAAKAILKRNEGTTP